MVLLCFWFAEQYYTEVSKIWEAELTKSDHNDNSTSAMTLSGDGISAPSAFLPCHSVSVGVLPGMSFAGLANDSGNRVVNTNVNNPVHNYCLSGYNGMKYCI